MTLPRGSDQGIFLKSRGLIELAIHIEESGRQAYEYFESCAGDEKLKGIWARLKGEEAAHTLIFKGMLQALPKDAAEQASADGLEAFVRALASSYVFTERRLAKVLLEDLRCDLDALAYGVFIEKESIFAYITLKDHVPPKDLPVVDRIIEEERRHLIQLTALIAELSGVQAAGKSDVGLAPA